SEARPRGQERARAAQQAGRCRAFDRGGAGHGLRVCPGHRRRHPDPALALARLIMLFGDLRSPALPLLDLAASEAVALLPLGTLEQHGPHLPLSTDTDIAWGLCQAVEALRPSGPGAIVLLPALPYGVSTYPLAPPGGLR